MKNTIRLTNGEHEIAFDFRPNRGRVDVTELGVRQIWDYAAATHELACRIRLGWVPVAD